MRRIVLAALLLTSACARSATTALPEITVFAASSLTGAFTDVAAAYQNSYDVYVNLVFGSSNSLARQINDGAPADVFASADTRPIRLAGRLAAAPPQRLAGNRLSIIVEKGNPRRIGSLQDLQRRRLLVVLCDEAVPCGAYARSALAKAGVKLTPASNEETVKGVVAKVATGEADAGIVYGTDAIAAADATDAVEIPKRYNVAADYLIAAMRTGKPSSRPHARSFVAFTLGPAGQAILRRHGFEPPR